MTWSIASYHVMVNELLMSVLSAVRGTESYGCNFSPHVELGP